ncbi:hypothetical protein [Microbacterium sp. H83]|uniref:hypothetical protein n=1 Tax=Microbacterium sp. H83 TaxID=1827324 RepID=UPI0007F43BFF|nr:hypothetical protein [Microbacterium sp. H83]OAN39773.1 hypothetical protein A4X16_14160 [Microbacterium sp. H83]
MRTDPLPPLSTGVKAVAWTASVFFGVIFFAFAWVWCGMSYEEQFSEQGRSVAAESSMEGWGFATGLVPVLVFHALVAIALLFALRDGGRRGWSASLALTPLVLAALSLPGFITVQLLYGGSMFDPPVYVP